MNIRELYKKETGQSADRTVVVKDSHGVECEELTLWRDEYVSWLQEKVEQLMKITSNDKK